MTRPVLKMLFAGLIAGAMVIPAIGGTAAAGQFSHTYVPATPQEAARVQAMLAQMAAWRGLQGNAAIQQNGYGNSAGIQQNGSGNNGYIFQQGNGHAGTLQQNGNNNSHGILQYGNGSNAGVVQNGDETGLTIVYGW